MPGARAGGRRGHRRPAAGEAPSDRPRPVGGKEFAESLSADVQKLLVSGTVRPVVRKKAALCLLRLYRRNPDALNKDDWADVILTLLDERDFGLLTSVLSLLHGLVQSDSSRFYGCLAKVLRLLERLVKNVDVPQDYLYYAIPSPWMQIKCMRILKHFAVAEDPTVASPLALVLRDVIANGAEPAKSQNKNNALQGILVEAVGLVMLLERDQELVDSLAMQLGRFISAKEPNTRYMGLENMGRLSELPQVAAAVKRNQAQIIESLHDPDISIRRRALDLLFGMCDAGNAESIVRELLDYLVLSDFAIREELVLRVAILAEKFMVSQAWYVDVILSLIDKAGDFVSDGIWCVRDTPPTRRLLSDPSSRHRVIQIVTNNPDLQQYAAEQVLLKLQAGSAHETMVRVAGYLLGEFGHLLSVPVSDYFALLLQRLPACSLPTKALLLSAFAKLVTHTSDPAVTAQINAVFERYHAFADVELQQRSVEYYTLSALHAPMLKDVLAEMPHFPERASALEKSLAGGAADQDAPDSQAASVSRGLRSGPSTPTSSLPLPARSDDLLGASFTAPAAGASGLDTLGGLESLMTAPTTAAPSRANHGLDDLLGGLGVATAPPTRAAAMIAAAAVPVAPLQEPGVWFRKLAAADSGVLYENPHLQLGVKCEWSGHAGRVALFLGNKHSAPLSALRAELVQVPGLRLSMAELPSTVGERLQVSSLVSASCTAPFPQPPSLSLSYQLSDTGAVVQFTVRLPIFATKFLSPAPTMEKARFYDAWRALVGPQKMEATVVAKPELAAGGLAAWQALFAGLRLALLPGVDPNPLNLFAASTLADEAGGGALVIVRLESSASSASQFRLTVASPSPPLCAAVHGLVVSICTTA